MLGGIGEALSHVFDLPLNYNVLASPFSGRSGVSFYFEMSG